MSCNLAEEYDGEFIHFDDDDEYAKYIAKGYLIADTEEEAMAKHIEFMQVEIMLMRESIMKKYCA